MLSFTGNYVVSVRRGFLFLLVVGMGCVILLWHSLGLPYNYFSTISTYDFSTLSTTLPHDLIKKQLLNLIENMFRLEKVLYLACNEERAFFASEEHKKYSLWTCQ